MITLDTRSSERVFGFRVAGKITRDDYRRFLPILEEAIEAHGKINVLVHLESFSGIELGAVWDELRFDLKHFRDFRRLALVGDAKWHEWSMGFARHLTPADGRHFPSDELESAWAWVESVEEPVEDVVHIGPVERILCPTDFSPCAARAIEWACRIAKIHDAELTVLHVAPCTTMTSLPLDIQEQVERGLASAKACAIDNGVSVESRWLIGRPWEAITEQADDYDLIVMGAKGRSPLRQMSLGSTADRVLRTAAVPVLAVHRDASVPALRPRHIIVPTDFSECASHALDTVARVFGSASDEGIDVTLLHAWQPLVEYGEVCVALPPPSPHLDTETQAMEMLETLAARVRTDSIRVTPVVRQGYPVKVIEDEVLASGADLVALGTHGHSGLARFLLGSVAERVVHHVPCPVLSVGVTALQAQSKARTRAEPETHASSN